ncbi:hypothetical protein T484DRAFT_1799647 [Baffinella frigidus]|nr:hypothetical protein T484DRAFT_1799647 [Cryptophyta sp. CCMP2293]
MDSKADDTKGGRAAMLNSVDATEDASPAVERADRFGLIRDSGNGEASPLAAEWTPAGDPGVSGVLLPQINTPRRLPFTKGGAGSAGGGGGELNQIASGHEARLPRALAGVTTRPPT